MFHKNWAINNTQLHFHFGGKNYVKRLKDIKKKFKKKCCQILVLREIVYSNNGKRLGKNNGLIVFGCYKLKRDKRQTKYLYKFKTNE